MSMPDHKEYPSGLDRAMTAVDQKANKIIVQFGAPRVKDVNVCGDVQGHLKTIVVASRSGES